LFHGINRWSNLLTITGLDLMFSLFNEMWSERHVPWFQPKEHHRVKLINLRDKDNRQHHE
jgi:hypothetical protein